MAISSVTSATAVPAPQKASATAPVDTQKTASKDSTAGEAAPSANFHVKMPPQPTSNALGHTIGQHLNLQA
nr:hypothetical protein [uncultured Albidiferax sp.]